MEAVDSKMRTSIQKSGKGGKHSKTLTAEEEARRREAIKETLREKLELERRAVKVVERLLEDSVSEDFLLDCAKFITAANYKDTIEERVISKMCGYPICPNKLGKIPTQQYKISTKTNKVYDITERKCFCCNFCYKASKEYEMQISKTPLWLRRDESPERIKLLKKGDGGSSGEEVMLKERRLKEEDIENPSATHPEDPHSSQLPVGDASQSDSDASDGEQEQDFVSSVVSQEQRPRVHWGELPKRADEDKTVERGRTERGKKKGKSNPGQAGVNEETKDSRAHETDIRPNCEKQQHRINPDPASSHADDPDVEEVVADIDLCSLEEKVTQALMDADSIATEAGIDLTTPKEVKKPVSSTVTVLNKDSASPNQSNFNITQVGMSRRGAAGLQDLLKSHNKQVKTQSLRHNLITYLKRTLNDWCTDETLKFLYGANHPVGSPFADVKEEEREELDEDDLEDEPPAVGKRPSAAAPNYDSLRRETEQLELRVREFYQGTCSLPEEVNGNKDQKVRDPSLPLTDSQAQHVIQKKITVEKLSNCLRNLVGPLHLTMSDVSTHLNNLVRTFRLTNTNIIHKTPQWTLIAVILLHLLSEVSPVVREALKTSTSAEYLNTLMGELGLHEQDLLNLVLLFKSPAGTE
ncbi:unnamed protein product [Ophioblennius macclurei]